METKANKFIRSNKSLILLVSIILIGVIGVMASTYVINSNGISVDGNKSFARTADVVVCRGNSALDDIIKSFQCDVVCLSTSSTCSALINQSINTLSLTGGGYIYLSEGVYPITNYISPASNIKLIGSGSSTILNLASSDEIFRYTGAVGTNVSNFEIAFMKFNRTSASSSVGIDFPNPVVSNIYIHDIDFGNINRDCFRININNLIESYSNNIHIENIVCNASFVIGRAENLWIEDSIFLGQSADRNTLGDIGFSENNASVKNIYIKDNYFQNLQINNPCIYTNQNASIKFIGNTFKCNGTSISITSDNTAITSNIDIVGNTFLLVPSGAVGAITSDKRSNLSIVNIADNNFIGDGSDNAKRGILLDMPFSITNNYFLATSNMGIGIQTDGHGIIEGNTLVDCDNANSGNRWIYLENQEDSTVKNNNFYAYKGWANAVIRIINGNRTTIEGNKYFGITANPYQLSNNAINTTYIDSYDYGAGISSLECSTSQQSPFYEKIIHNSTNLALCTGGNWVIV